MSIANISLLLTLATIINVVCLVLLGVATAYNVRNYRVLRSLQTRERRSALPTDRYDSRHETDRPLERSAPPRAKSPERARTETVEDVPDNGQIEWTGPVTPYVPKHAQKSD